MRVQSILGSSPGPSRSGIDGLSPWVRAVAVVGLPGVIAIYLVWVVATVLPGKLDAHAAESRADSTRMLQLLQQICVNTAATPEQRVGCWGSAPR